MVTEKSISDLKAKNGKFRKTLINVHSRRWMGNVLIVTDMLSLSIAIFVGIQVRHLPFTVIVSSYSGLFLVLGITITYLFLRRGLYPPIGMHYADELRHIVTTTSMAFLIIIGVTFVSKTSVTYSRLVLIFTWLLCLPLIPFSRYIVRRLLIRLGLWGEIVAIVGDLHKTQILADYFKTRLQYGFLPVALFCDHTSSGDTIASWPILPIGNIKVYAHKFLVKTVLIIVEDLNNLDSVVKNYNDTFQWIILIKDKYENYGLTFLKPLDFHDVLGLQVRNYLLSRSTQTLKRVVDITLSFLVLLILTPFLLLIAIIIKWESNGDAFYRQHRLGKDGQVFNLLKFRTMHQNAEEIFKKEVTSNPDKMKEWDSHQKLRNDPRITRTGRFLRRFSLDEIPQLWNVLKGEMSLVGPRPIMVNQRKMYGETIKESSRVRPGITGLWQVSGRNHTTFARRAKLDLEYIQRWSIWLDIYIMLKTIKVVIWQHGAY